jgi:serine/threonine protein kinase
MEKAGKFVDLRTKTFMGMEGSLLADRYELHNLLGSGGMGAVFRGTQKAVGRHVAVKVLPRIDPLTAARFQREARTVSKLSHPNTITVFDFGQSEEGYLFLVMEYLEGRTLRELIKDGGALPPRRAVHIVHQICRSLSEAHANGIVHRDIKPDNIFLIHRDDDPDFVKVLDFGIAKAMYGDDPDDDITQQGRIVGTPRYMSPEQVLGLPVDHRADIYSLGIILYQLLTGSPPFDDSSTAMLMMKHAHEMPPPLAEKLSTEAMAQMPAGLEAVVMKAISKRPETRQQTIDMMRTELELVMPSVNSEGGRGRATGMQPILREDFGFHGPYSTPDPSSTSNPALTPPPAQPWGRASGAWDAPPRASQQLQAARASQRLPAMYPADGYDGWSPPPRNNRLGILLFGGALALFLLMGVTLGAFFFWQTQYNKPAQSPQAPLPPQGELPALARITIQSTPSGATVKANDENIGMTPMVIEVPRARGEVTYTVSLDGYQTMTRRVALQSVPSDGDTWDLHLAQAAAPDAAPGEEAPGEPPGDEAPSDEERKAARAAWKNNRPRKNEDTGAADKATDAKATAEVKAAPAEVKAPPAEATPPADANPRKPRIEALDANPSGNTDQGKTNKPKVEILE